MNIPVISGRAFYQEDAASAGGAYIFNETARLQYDLVAGEYITGNAYVEVPPAVIAGFIDDVKYASFRTTVEPMAFYVPAEKDLSRSQYPRSHCFHWKSVYFGRQGFSGRGIVL